MKHQLLSLLTTFALLTPLTLFGQDPDIEIINQLFSQSIEVAEQGDIQTAIVLMDSVRQFVPESPNPYWNLGIWYGQTDEYEKALKTWLKFRELEPDDWHARAKLIQTYQALNDTLNRDYEREELLRLWTTGTDSTLASEDMYCRDQFSVENKRILAYETFAPSGNRMVFYTFYILDSLGETASRFSLGSYEMTTQLSRELGEISKDERIYHLDEYGSENYNHATWGMFVIKPFI